MIGFVTTLGSGRVRKASKPIVLRETSLKKSGKKTVHNIQILVSPMRDETLPRKVVSPLHEARIYVVKLKPMLSRDPDQPRPSLGTNARMEGRQFLTNSLSLYTLYLHACMQARGRGIISCTCTAHSMYTRERQREREAGGQDCVLHTKVCVRACAACARVFVCCAQDREPCCELRRLFPTGV